MITVKVEKTEKEETFSLNFKTQNEENAEEIGKLVSLILKRKDKKDEK
jgi:hypothetical protein